MAAAVDANGVFLAKYLERVGEENVPDLNPTSAVLKAVMSAQTRAIAFENLDVALGRTISMDAEDVTRKLIDLKRGGYCFEQNTLLKLALEAIGFKVTPLLCRVRWGKKPDEETAFTHMCLKVEVEGEGEYLADVGFAGTNSIEPIPLDAASVPHALSDGTWWTEERDGYVFLKVKERGEESGGGGEMVGRELYCWQQSGCLKPDLLQANHWSCTWGSARFTSQLFVAITNEDQTEKMHILNNTFVRRAIGGAVQETREISNVAELEELLQTRFRLDLRLSDPGTIEAIESTDGVARYLARA